jgi:hypothetical protein
MQVKERSNFGSCETTAIGYALWELFSHSSGGLSALSPLLLRSRDQRRR